MTQILITGGSGLIGGEVQKQLGQVWAPSSQELDLSTPFTLREKVDTIIHLAQSPYYREFPEKAEHVFQVNTASTQRLLDYAVKVGAKTFILASSGAVYGSSDVPLSETDALQGKGFYAASKRSAEVIAESYRSHLTVHIVRFFFVYGPSQKPTMLMPRLLKNVAEGVPIMLQGQEGIRINPIHAEDAARYITKLIDFEESSTFNIAGNEVVSLREVAAMMGDHPKFTVQDQPPQHLVGNVKQLYKQFGPPRLSLKQGIESLKCQHTM